MAIRWRVGLVYTYAAGTTSPLPTYTDSTGVVANANPVVLDAGGFANIWLGSSLYKIVIQTSAGVTISTTDNVSNTGVALSTRAVVTNPVGNAAQAVSGPLSLGSYGFTAGAATLAGVTVAQANNSAVLSAELNTTPAGWTTGTNVVNSGGGLYTFTAPAGAISTSLSVSSGQRFVITWSLGSIPTDTCGTLTVSVGTASQSSTWSCTDTGVQSIAADVTAVASGTLTLSFTPDTSFHGHLSNISVKRITAVQPASLAQTDTGGNSLELRSNSAAANVGVGLGALQSAAPGASAGFGNSGMNNTAFGNNALTLNSSGYKNTAFGNALQANTVGYYNSAFGYGALQSNTGGYRNTALGILAAYSLTTGQGNTAIGDEALYAATTPKWNVAVGSSACQDLTVGDQNTCIGVSALNLSTTGRYNTALGESAMQDETSGNNNTAVGTGALICLNLDGSFPTTCSENNVTTVGQNSLYYALNASDLTAIGYYAGEDLFDITNANKKIAQDTQMTLLGEMATKNTASTLTNSTCIGYRAWCTASNQFVFGNGSVTSWQLGTQYSLTADTSRLGASGLRLQSTAVANSPSYYTALPNGTGNESGVRFYNASDATNTGAVSINVVGATAAATASNWGTGTLPTVFQFAGLSVQVSSILTVSQLPTCGSAQEGTIQPVKDSANTTFAGPLTGGGTYHVLAYCTGSGWSVH